MDPAFVLLDEPFAGVDPISVKDISTDPDSVPVELAFQLPITMYEKHSICVTEDIVSEEAHVSGRQKTCWKTASQKFW